ncbi:MAG: efflux RND transporter periplasmic adaptor subunit [Bacteroidota bacterium]
MKVIVKFSAIAFIMILLTLFMSCNEAKKEEKLPVRPVLYTTVEIGAVGKSRTFSGVINAQKIINLSFRQPGKIVKLPLAVGQRVKKGQLLGKLDNVQARLGLEQGQAQLIAAESNLTTAKLSLERIQTLYEKGSTSLTDLEQAKNRYQTALKGFEASEKGVAILKEQVVFGQIYAPENGIISTIMAELNENVGAGQPIAVLDAAGPLEIKLGVPEGVINRIEIGMKVEVEISSMEAEVFKGEVTEVAPSNGLNSATYPITVKLLDQQESVKSGMTADVTFQFGQDQSPSDKLMVPPTAVG